MTNDSQSITFRVTRFNKNKEGLLHITNNDLVVRSEEDLNNDIWYENFINRYTDDIVMIRDEYGALVSPKGLILATKVFGTFYRFNKRPYYEFLKLSDDLFDDKAKELVIMLREGYVKYLKISIHSYKNTIEEYKSSINICKDSMAECEEELSILDK